MSSPRSLTDIPEEAEIDRLLRELGIVLPEQETVPEPERDPVQQDPAVPLLDDVEPSDTEEPLSYWLASLPDRQLPWPPETES